MRILTISDYWPTPANPISGIFAQYQAEEFARQGHEVSVIAPVPLSQPRLQRPLRLTTKGLDVWSPRVPLVPGLRYTPVPIRAMLFEAAISLYAGRIAALIQKHGLADGVDGVHMIGHTFAGLSLASLRAQFRQRVVLTLQGEDPLLLSVAGRVPVRALIRASWDAADFIALCGSPLRTYAQSLGAPADKLVVIPNGNDVFGKPATSNAADSATITIVSVSNLNRTKGIHINLEALRILRDRHSHQVLRYWIVGDGPELRRLRAQAARLGLADIVRFLGRLSHAQTLRVVTESTLLCLPSYVEAFGIVYLEAMAAGKPVIGCVGTGAGDLIVDGETGYLVRAQDPQAVADALEKLVNDAALREAMGHAALNRARLFSWEANVRKYVALLDRAVRSASPNASSAATNTNGRDSK